MLSRDDLRPGEPSEAAVAMMDRLKLPRTPAVEAEAMAALVVIYELMLEAYTDKTRAFPLRVERMAARRSLIAATLPSTNVQPAPLHTPTGKRIGPTIEDSFAEWSKTVVNEKTRAAFKRHSQQFPNMMHNPVLSSIDGRELDVKSQDVLA